MAQSQNPTDSQALVQSMLQRLKIQPGRDNQACSPPSVRITATSTWHQDGERGAPNLQKSKNSPVNGFDMTANGISPNKLQISAADSNAGLKGGKIQQPHLSCEVDRGLISNPTQKGTADGSTGDNRMLGQASQPGITTTETGQLFPDESLKDADVTSSERTGVERVSFGSLTVTSNKDVVSRLGQNQDQHQGFTPKVFAWSLKPASVDPGSQEHKVLHTENGAFGALVQSKDTPIVSADQNSGSRRKPRLSDSKTRRWTQKLKERWKDRPGSLGKKPKGEEREEHQTEQGTEISAQNQLLTVQTVLTPNKEGEKFLSSPDGSDLSKTALPHTEDCTNNGRTRASGDFDLGLGSFSLLDEIAMGQEWAKFLNPNQSAAASANQKPSEELKLPNNRHDGSQPSLNFSPGGGVNQQYVFRGTEGSPFSKSSMAQISPDDFLPASMNTSEGKLQQFVHREAEKSEPMDHGHTPSYVQSLDSRMGQQLRPSSFPQSNSSKSRVHLNRKRHHQSSERSDEALRSGRMSDAKETDRERSLSSLSRTSSHMEVTGESQQDTALPLYNLNSPPLSPTSINPAAHPAKGVLKHSISQDSECSVEILTKKRRVEENRRVHFSEKVETIVPPELDVDATDSEGDSETEGDSMTEQDVKEEQAVIEEVAPARRQSFSSWMLALKRNTGRKVKVKLQK